MHEEGGRATASGARSAEPREGSPAGSQVIDILLVEDEAFYARLLKAALTRRAPGNLTFQIVHIEDMQHRGRRCIWSHPEQGGVMITRYPQVPLGSTSHRRRRGIPEAFSSSSDQSRFD